MADIETGSAGGAFKPLDNGTAQGSSYTPASVSSASSSSSSSSSRPPPSSASSGSPAWRLLRYALWMGRWQSHAVVLSVVLNGLAIILLSFLPKTLGEIYDKVLGLGANQFSELYWLLGELVFIKLSATALSTVGGVLNARSKTFLSHHFRNFCLADFLGKDLAFFHRYLCHPSEIIQRLLNDSPVITDVVSAWLPGVVLSVVGELAYVGVTLSLGLPAPLFVLGMGAQPLLAFAAWRNGLYLRQAALQFQAARGAIVAGITMALSNLEFLKLQVVDQSTVADQATRSRALMRAEFGFFTTQFSVAACISVLEIAVHVVLFIASLDLIIQKQISLGAYLAFDATMREVHALLKTQLTLYSTFKSQTEQTENLLLMLDEKSHLEAPQVYQPGAEWEDPLAPQHHWRSDNPERDLPLKIMEVTGRGYHAGSGGGSRARKQTGNYQPLDPTSPKRGGGATVSGGDVFPALYLTPGAWDITVHNLSFAYPTFVAYAASTGRSRYQSYAVMETNTPVLRHVAFHVVAGQLALLVGPSGCGKSTLAKLLGQLYAPQRGQLGYDSVVCSANARGTGLVLTSSRTPTASHSGSGSSAHPMDDLHDPDDRTGNGHTPSAFNDAAPPPASGPQLDPRLIRCRVGFLLQDAPLFAGTVLDNLYLGFPKFQTALEVEEACMRVMSFIADNDFPLDLHAFNRGLRTRVINTASLPSALRFKLALLRCVLHPYSVVVLDDPLHTLDRDALAWLQQWIGRDWGFKSRADYTAHSRRAANANANAATERKREEAPAFKALGAPRNPRRPTVLLLAQSAHNPFDPYVDVIVDLARFSPAAADSTSDPASRPYGHDPHRRLSFDPSATGGHLWRSQQLLQALGAPSGVQLAYASSASLGFSSDDIESVHSEAAGVYTGAGSLEHLRRQSAAAATALRASGSGPAGSGSPALKSLKRDPLTTPHSDPLSLSLGATPPLPVTVTALGTSSAQVVSAQAGLLASHPPPIPPPAAAAPSPSAASLSSLHSGVVLPSSDLEEVIAQARQALSVAADERAQATQAFHDALISPPPLPSPTSATDADDAASPLLP